VLFRSIKVSGQIIRSSVAEVPAKGRDTMGVKFVGVAEDDSVAVIALNPESTGELPSSPNSPSENGEGGSAVNPQGTVDADEPGAEAVSEAGEENGD